MSFFFLKFELYYFDHFKVESQNKLSNDVESLRNLNPYPDPHHQQGLRYCASCKNVKLKVAEVFELQVQTGRQMKGQTDGHDCNTLFPQPRQRYYRILKLKFYKTLNLTLFHYYNFLTNS